ncbi:MAG: hypothetical protein HY320_13340 [Armatimonadetes bacterium]|nr:hypothetical protein [Armatimonadota bacterium]
MRRDTRGRRRAAGQERGLRPLYPPLPSGWVSRALRVAMPLAGWRQFNELVERLRPEEPTKARAAGQALMALMDAMEARAGDQHWLDWEREKTLRLLQEAHKAA